MDRKRIETIVTTLREFSRGPALAGAERGPERNAIASMASELAGEANATAPAQADSAATLRRYQALADNLPGVAYVVHLDDGGRIELLNGMLSAITGYREEDLARLAASGPLPFAHPRDRQRVAEELSTRALSGERFDVTYRAIREDGTLRWFREHGRGLLDPQGQLSQIHGLILDVTEERRLAARLRDSQRIDAIATLAGGIAHEMNNVLAVVLGLAAVWEEDTSEGDPLHEDAAAMVGAARRGKVLIQRLLEFARRSEPRRTAVSLPDAVRHVVEILQRTIGQNVTLAVETADSLWPVLADPGQMGQALLNLCINAAQALDGRGTVRISATNVVLSAADLADHPNLSAGRYARVRVEDSGCGMDPETCRRAVEPFFTTQGDGAATGLGLAATYGIVQDHGGELTIASTLGHGTAVTILLPAVSEGALADSLPPTSAVFQVPPSVRDVSPAKDDDCEGEDELSSAERV